MSNHEAVEEKKLQDQGARDLITSALDRNVMVLAGAGAGKTHALIERMVASVRTGTARVDGMAAITFTRKAAGEMRGRFLLRLRDELAQVKGNDAERIREALQKIDQCFIGTIHSFCGRLLRERPIEAGLSPDFSEIEEREEAILRREAWDRFVQECIAADDDRIYALEDHGINPEDLYTFFGRRCGYRDLPLKETRTSSPNLVPAVRELERFIARVAPHIPENPEGRDKLMDSVRRARHFLDNHGAATDRDRATLLKLFEGHVGVTLKNWAEERSFAKEVRDDHLPELQNRVIAPALTAWRECAYRLVADFVNDAVAFYDRMRQVQGNVTFQDLLLRTEALLRDFPEVRTYFQRRFECILVDEFQDTDPVQARIVMYLTGTDIRQKDWLKLRPRPGSLFLVGDDKQSIYRFRRADVETFRQVRQRIEATGGEVVHLNTSFRSLGHLCRWISGAFPSIFEAPSDPYQARFQPLHDVRPPGVDPHCVRKITIPKVHRNTRRDIVEADAGRIAGYIAAAIQGETPLNHAGDDGILDEMASAGDFMILTRTSTQISEYARALEARGIPFDVVGGGRLGESPEIKTLVDLLETVFAPHNPVPYLSVLRGPIVGLADDEIYALRQAGGSFHYRAAIPEGLMPDLRERLSAAQQLLKTAEKLLTTRPPGSAMEQILEESGLLAYSAVHPDGQSSFRAGNLLRVLSVIRHHEAKGRHWGQIIEDLRDLVGDSAYDLEEMTLEVGRDDVVRLMNLHQAKGLQAKVVFLADPYDLTAYKWKPDVHVSREGADPYLSMTVTKPKGDYATELVAQPVGWSDDLAQEEQYEAGEEVRLLYVAATRARNLLVVSCYDGNPSKGPWHPLYRYLDEIPELADCRADLSASSSSQDIDWKRIRERQPVKMEKIRALSHDIRTVSGTPVGEGLEYVSREGRGRSYGIVVHQILEDAVCGRLPADEDAYVRRVAREAGLDAGRADDAARALGRFKASRIWQEVSESDAVFTEVPIGKAEAREVVRGVIDLVYRSGESWKIVDYKTDLAETEIDVAHLEHRYRPQVDAYAAYWEEITGETVESASLWFVHGPAKEDQLSLF